MEYLKVKNWEKYQQYKDREPKWIKLYRSVLDDYQFSRLSDVNKAHLMLIWLLAAKLDNHIPADKKWIAISIHATEPIDIKGLVDSGFILYESVQNCTEPYLDKIRLEKIREETEEEEDCSEPKTAPEPSVAPVVILTYPTHGKKKTWDLTEAFASDLHDAFPALDITGECRKALVWLKANPTKQKTAVGMSKFLFSWCGREQDKSKGGGSNYANAKDEAALRHARVGQWNPPDPRDAQRGM